MELVYGINFMQKPMGKLKKFIASEVFIGIERSLFIFNLRSGTKRAFIS